MEGGEKHLFGNSCAMDAVDDAMGMVRSTFPGSGDAMEGGDDALGVVRSKFPGSGDAMAGGEKYFWGER